MLTLACIMGWLHVFKSTCIIDMGITRIRELYVPSFHKVKTFSWCEQGDLDLSISPKGNP